MGHEGSGLERLKEPETVDGDNEIVFLTHCRAVARRNSQQL